MDQDHNKKVNENSNKQDQIILNKHQNVNFEILNIECFFFFLSGRSYWCITLKITNLQQHLCNLCKHYYKFNCTWHRKDIAV